MTYGITASVTLRVPEITSVQVIPHVVKLIESAWFGERVPLENSVSCGDLVFHCGTLAEVLRRHLRGRPRWDHIDRLWLTALSRLVNRDRVDGAREPDLGK